MDGALFRQEVVQARTGGSVGRIVAVPAWPLWAGVAVVLFAAVGLVLLLALGSYTRQMRVTGELQPSLGLTRMDAPMAGTLARLDVREGQRVLAGQVIAEIHAVREGRAGDTGDITRESLSQRWQASRRVLAASREQLQHRKRGLQQQVAELEAEGGLVRAQYEALGRRLALAVATRTRMRQLKQQRYVSDLQLSQHEAEVIDQEAALLALRRQALSLGRSMEQARQSLAEWPSQWAELQAQADRESALLRAEAADIEARSHALLRAPVAGIVSRIEVHVGQPVHVGQVILGLLPAVSRLEAHLHVPSSAMGLVAPGDRVQLRYHAYPYQDHGHFGGRVVRVDGAALVAGDVPAQAGFRVVVAPDRQAIRVQGALRPLKPGLTLDAHVLGERRRLWRWALSPLRRLSDPLSTGHMPMQPPAPTRRREEVSPAPGTSAGIQRPPAVL